MAAKTIVVLIAIWSVIQGFVYGMISILALLAHDCQISMRQSKLTYLMYIIFFRDGRCERIDWNIVANVPPPYEPKWPSVTAVAFRTNILASIYLLLSTIWIIASLLLIVGCFMRCLGKAAYYFLMMPWALFCTLTAIFDVVAVGFFFYDLFNTLNMDAFVHHLQMRDTTSIFSSLEIDANILPMPAVILLLVSCRGFIFWCLNILSIPIVLSHCKQIIYDGKVERDSVDDRDFQYERNRSHDSNVLEQHHFPSTGQHSRYSDPSHYHRFQYDNISYQQDQYDLGKTIGRRYVEPLKTESIDEPDAHVKRNLPSRMSSNEDKSSKRSNWSDDSGHSNSTVHLTHQQAHNRKNPNEPFNWHDMPMERVLRIDRPHFRLPSKPSLLKKLSDSSYVTSGESSNATTLPHTSEELRSQLPWSYFGAGGGNLPRKSFSELREDEDLPPVPVPDYTMNLSRMKDGRPVNGDRKTAAPPKKFINPKRGTPNEFDSTRWSGPEYRY